MLNTASRMMEAKNSVILSAGGNIKVSHPVKCHIGRVNLRNK